MPISLDNESHYGLGRSLLSPKDIVRNAKLAGYSSVALTDLMNINGMVEFSRACLDNGIKPIIGCKLRVYIPHDFDANPDAKKGTEPTALFNVWVLNDEGMLDLMKILSLAHNTDHFYRVPRVSIFEIIFHARRRMGLAFGAAFEDSPLIKPEFKRVATLIAGSCSSFPFLMPIGQELSPLHQRVNQASIEWLYDINESDATSSAALYPAHVAKYQSESEASAYDTMVGIISNTATDSRWFKKRWSHGETPSHPSIDRASLPALSYVSTTRYEELADAVTYEWAPKPISLPKITEDEDGALDDALSVGWESRFSQPIMGHQPTDAELAGVYKERLDYEVGVLKSMGFVRYFLVVADLVQWSKASGISVGPGRGSAGGSLVAYLMGITDVDPIRFGLIFERFINPDRLDLPDADLDFASTRRSEVIAYLTDKYGEKNTAGISNYVSLGAASALRDTGRIHGKTPLELVCTKQIPALGTDLEEAAKSIPDVGAFVKRNPEIFNTAQKLQGVMRNMGQHAAGVVVTEDTDGARLADRAVVETRKGTTMVNWDRMSVEDWGLVKIDVLGLSTLDAIMLTLDSIEDDIEPLKLPLDDEKTLIEFSRGNTVGVFQFEGSGMRGTLKALAEGGILNFEDLYTTTALYRPGPMESGMLESYVNIRQGHDRVFYDHPLLEPILKRTLGQLVFQEQVMEVARTIAGYTMAEADKLRKIMGKKQPEEMAAQKDKFVAGAVATVDMPEGQASDLFDSVEKFAGYGFNKSHSVAYTMISYWGMYLKTHYPYEYTAAALTIAKDDTKVRTIVTDAKNNGITVMPPSINISTDSFTVGDYEGQKVVYASLNAVKGISDNCAKNIIKKRAELGGKFESKMQLRESLTGRQLNATQLKNLVLVGALYAINDKYTSLPPLHEDRLRDQMELMPGVMSSSVTVDRHMDMTVVKPLIHILHRDDIGPCVDCELKGTPHPLPSFGKTPRIMVITDDPSSGEAGSGKLMARGAKREITSALVNSDLALSDCYFTTLVKAKKLDKMLSATSISACRKYLDKEIEILKPPIIIALGSTTVRQMMPSLKGSIMELSGQCHYIKELDATLICGISPGMVFYDPSKQNDLDDVFAQAAAMLIEAP